ncbi:hypothetical protein VA7868_02343 [Vibrio aerogenes CECT 7868]|uniref:DUF2589 domain-containing protein n=2 Tax=Vibrio aerogenes TaxID=92172 RepID=A0A1M5Z666_9VIBR|nr:DUF2589 domain-containing protein [Vibrio aerogenes]SHI19746.1 hypothetical protein VA7868_02343 [Vibrio aerogenes CECT 7868]
MPTGKITNQFTGLPMKDLISAPLKAACDSQIELASSTLSFIRSLGFDELGQPVSTAFSYHRESVTGKDVLGNDVTETELVSLNVPVLAIVDIPGLRIDDVSVTFDISVNSAESDASQSDRSLGNETSLSGTGLFISKGSTTFTGSVSSHQEHTRKSDNAAKYHVEISASQGDTPEGLARVLDMIAAGIRPGRVERDNQGEDTIQCRAEITAADHAEKEFRAAEIRYQTAKANLELYQREQARHAPEQGARKESPLNNALTTETAQQIRHWQIKLEQEETGLTKATIQRNNTRQQLQLKQLHLKQNGVHPTGDISERPENL